MSLERQISQLNNGKQTAKPKKRKAERRGPTGSNLTMGLYANEFTSVYRSPAITSNGNGMSRITGNEIMLTVDVEFIDGVAAETSVSKVISFTTDAFSWLKQYAKLYDLYKFHSLRFTWQPTLSTVFSGNVAMYFDPGVLEAGSSSFVELSNNYGSVTSSIHQPSSVPVKAETLNRLNWFEVFGGGTTESIGSVGTFFLRTNSLTGVIAATGRVTVGYIWVTYDATFKNPTDPSH